MVFNPVTCKAVYHPRLCKKSGDSCLTVLNVSILLAKDYSAFAFENNKNALEV